MTLVGKLIAYSDVQSHSQPGDCWVVINNVVYDLSKFAKSHPGGIQVVLDEAGTDATEAFLAVHSPHLLDTLPAEARLGPVDQKTLPAPQSKPLTDEQVRLQKARAQVPPLESMFLVRDFEFWAQRVLPEKSWGYYCSAADEERTLTENMNAFTRYFFRPRMLRDMRPHSLQTSFAGITSELPLFISPAAMAKLGHPLGEVNLTRAAGKAGIVQGISANASCSLEEMFAARTGDQPLLYQIYIDGIRADSEKILQKVERFGAKAIIFTVDIGWQSKRTYEFRMKGSIPNSSLGHMVALGGLQDRNLSWDDIQFIRRNAKLPIIVKGIQCLEDVQLCIDRGVEAVILSNHGGRQLDYAPAPIDILYEIRSHRPDMFSKIDIMIDGGIRTGADVVKAVALGAKAVGLGRPILYGNATHGEAGVTRVIDILREEITNTMKNMGAATLEDLRPEMVGPAGSWVGANRPLYAPVMSKF